MVMRAFSWTGLKLGCATVALSLAVSGASVRAEEKELTIPETVLLVKSKNKGARARVTAIERLGDMTNAGEIRDYRVAEELVTLATEKEGDLFVRIAAIKALGKLTVNADAKFKDKYMANFTAIFKDPKEHFQLRRAVSSIFRDVLNKKDLPDKDAYRGLVDVAKNKQEPVGLRSSAILAIGNFGADDSLETLVPLLSDPEPIVVEQTAAAVYEALNRSAGTELPLPAINKLVEMLDSKTVASELKVNVMKVLAQIMREGKTTAAKAAFPKIVEFVKNNPDDKLVKGGIEALGIIGSAEAVEPLKQAYADYKPAVAAPGAAAGDAPAVPASGEAANAKKQEKAKETDIRMAVIEALISVLNGQGEKKNAYDQKAVHESTVLLVKAAEDDPASNVQRAAIFALRYLYYAKFKNEHREVVDALTFKMREPKTTDELKKDIAETLSFITGQDFGTDAERWNKWFETNMGGKRGK
ncbi:MAG TPA: HEAT repeat domain-containing protein [Planctomycetota bacterium]|nr:HEAT repeat domain-containing protein [Planctomycetota bacterium]